MCSCNVNFYYKLQIFCAESTLRKYPAALKKLHEERGVEFPPVLSKSISNYMKGIRKRIASEKKAGIRDVLDGKAKLSWSAYRMLCAALMRAPSKHQPETVQLFFIMAWNMIARFDFDFYLTADLSNYGRSDTTSSVKLNHFSWENDSLVINVCQHKGDQEGMGRLLSDSIYLTYEYLCRFAKGDNGQALLCKPK